MMHSIVKIVGALWCDNVGLFELDGACILNKARILNFVQRKCICSYTLKRLVKVQLRLRINIYKLKLNLVNI